MSDEYYSRSTFLYSDVGFSFYKGRIASECAYTVYKQNRLCAY